MTQEQQDKIVGILRADCKITQYFINEQGETCARGALALAAGVKKSELGGPHSLKFPEHSKIERLTGEVFGLTYSQQMRLAIVNNAHTSAEKRRAACIKYIKSLPITL